MQLELEVNGRVVPERLALSNGPESWVEVAVNIPAGVLVQADGELAGGLPLKIGIRDQAFPLVIPRKH